MDLRRVLFLSVAVLSAGLPALAGAETLPEAMAAAYANNPTLNAARAGTRAADEAVPQALAGYRPQISIFAQAGIQKTSTHAGLNPSGEANYDYYYAPLVVGLQVVQPIYTGGRVGNAVKAAEASVRAARESLRNAEQTTLLDAVTAYMDVILSGEILALRRANVKFLEEQVRATTDRFHVGAGTNTDVSQAEAALAAARATVSAAEADALSAGAAFVQVIGHKPKGLAGPGGASRLLPSSLPVAIDASHKEHPAILAALHNVDTASANVAIAEGALLPTFSIVGTVQQAGSTYNGDYGYDNTRQFDGSVIGRLSIPVYQGGGEYSEVRQAKEALGQRRLQVDAARQQVAAQLTSAWGALEASKAQIGAAEAGVAASRLALDGVIQERDVGQRTTLDVLDSQSTLINARISLVSAERNSVVASYTVLAAMGRLDRGHLGLKTAAYRPEAHYEAVRDAWVGLRTPSGD